MAEEGAEDVVMDGTQQPPPYNFWDEMNMVEHGLATSPYVQAPVERLVHVLHRAVNGLLEVQEMTTLIGSWLYKVISTTLKRTDIEDSGWVGVMLFRSIDLVLHFGRHDIADVWKEILFRIFNDTYKFYVEDEENMLPFPEDEDGEEPPVGNVPTEEAIARGDVYAVHPPNNWSSPILVSCINYFGKQGGFDILINRLTDTTRDRVSTNLIKFMLKPIVKAREYLADAFLGAWMERVFDLLRDIYMGLSDEDLKNEDKVSITEVFRMVDVLYAQARPLDAPPLIESFTLEFGLKCLKTQYLEKRLGGLSEIRDHVRQVHRKSEYLRRAGGQEQGMSHRHYAFPNVFMDGATLIGWIRDNNFVETLYGPGSHLELMRRSVDIMKFLASEGALTDADLELMWDAGLGKHEAVEVIIYTSLWDLAAHLTLDQLRLIHGKILELPFTEYASHTVKLIRYVTMYAINAMCGPAAAVAPGEAPPVPTEWFGMDLFWELIQDEAPVSEDISGQAIVFLHELLNWGYCYSKRPEFIARCVSNIAEHRSVCATLKLLGKILGTFPQRDASTETVSSVIESLDADSGLLDHFFADLVHYKAAAREAKDALLAAAADPDSVNVDKTALIGRYCHLANMQERLNFLNYVLTNSAVSLETGYVDTLWECCIENALTVGEREDSFMWLETTCSVPDSFTNEVIHYIFKDKVDTLDLGALSPQGFLFFEYFFRFINWRERRFDQSTSQNITVLSPELIGMDQVWKICYAVRSPDVARMACQFLLKLYQSLAPQLRGLLPQKREEYVKNCMVALSEGAGDGAEGGTVADPLKIERALTLLKMLLEDSAHRKGAVRHGANTRGTPMNLPVAILSHLETSVDVHSNETLADLRTKIGAKCEPPESARNIRIITRGRELKEDGRTLSELGVCDGQRIHATIRPKAPDYAGGGAVGGGAGDEAGGADGDEDDSVYPEVILSKAVYFDELFRMLFLPREAAEQVWDLLMYLPTNPRMLEDIRLIDEADGPDKWVALLDPTSTFKLFYCLQIVEAQIYGAAVDDSDGQAGRLEWCRRFVTTGGAAHLLLVFMNTDLQDAAAGGRRKACLATLIKLINFFFLDVSPYEPSVAAVTPSTLRSDMNASLSVPIVDKLLSLIAFAAVPQVRGGEGQDPANAEDVAVVRHAALLLAAVLVPDMSGFVSRYDQLPEWLEDVLLRCNVAGVRGEAGAAICRIAAEPAATSDGDGDGTPAPLDFVLDTLLGFLDKTNDYAAHCEQFYVVLTELVSMKIEAAGGADSFADTLAKLVDMLNSHPITEARFTEERDEQLIGILRVTATIVGASDQFKVDHAALVSSVFDECLFDIPTVDNHGALAPPKCKTQEARRAAFGLLKELASACLPNYEELTGRMADQHVARDRRITWHYLPRMYEKSPTGYVGLENLGATCYMNSLIQQFYMIPKLRYALLGLPRIEAPALPAAGEGGENGESGGGGGGGGGGGEGEKGSEPDADAVAKADAAEFLHQLQTLFGHLQESERKFYDTRPFCASYKDYDGRPMNTHVQMDVDEFFNMLMDRLEGLVKGTDAETVLSELFGGVSSNQVICQEQGHVSEREESFYTISLEMKDKKNMAEALDLFIEGDVLEGDNKYSCSACEAKVDALKRCCLKALPNTLIVHLKRFEFDFELLKRMKVNEKFEFPTKLNMQPWTLEGIAKREAAERAAAEHRSLTDDELAALDAEFKPDSYYEYELVGVLVHTGTADTGHYYSFIKSRDADGKWYRFNDMQVDEFDAADIPAQCFGGMETVSTWDSVQRKSVPRVQHKPYNAYMLFYGRREVYPFVKAIQPKDGEPIPARPALQPLPPDDLPVTRADRAARVPTDIFESCWSDNMNFLRDKDIFDTDYFEFIADIVRLESPNAAAAALEYVDDPGAVDGEGVPFNPLYRAIQLGTAFVIETLLHAKEKAALGDWVDHLKTCYSQHIPACQWFVSRLVGETNWAHSVLLACTVADARQLVAELISHVVATLAPYERPFYEQETILDSEMGEGEVEDGELPDAMNPFPITTRPKALVLQFMDKLLLFLNEAPAYWRHFSHLFMVLADTVALSAAERAYFLRREAVARLIHFYMEDQSKYFVPLPPGQKYRRMGDKFRPPQLDYLVAFLSTLICSCKFALPDEDRSPAPERAPAPAGTPLEFNHTLGPRDHESLMNETFFRKLVTQGMNTGATGRIMAHLAWENRGMSDQLISIVVGSLSMSPSEDFKAHFEVLSPLLLVDDTLMLERVDFGMRQLVGVVKSKAEYKTDMYVAVRCMVDLAEENCAARAWLRNNTDMWLEAWLLESTSDMVREEAESLVKATIPQIWEQLQTDTRALAAGPPVEGDDGNRRGAGSAAGSVSPDEYTDETKQALARYRDVLFDLLDAGLTGYIGGAEGEGEGVVQQTTQLVPYFRLLQLVVVTKEDKDSFTPYWHTFWALFTEMDALHHECDENKKEMVEFWLVAVEGCPNTLSLITAEDKYATRMMDFFISLRPADRYLHYNKEALPSWYRLLYLCGAHDPRFIRVIHNHRNWDWAIKNLYRESAYYVPVADVLFPTLELCCSHAEFREKHIPLVVSSQKLPANAKNLLNFLDKLIATQDDAVLFCQSGGLEQLSKFIELRRDIEPDDKLVPYVCLGLDIFSRVSKWMTLPDLSPELQSAAAQVSATWDNKIGLLSTLLNFLGVFADVEVRARLFAIVGDLIRIDSECLEEVLTSLYNEHECRVRDDSEDDGLDTETESGMRPAARVKFLLGELTDDELEGIGPEASDDITIAYYSFVCRVAATAVREFASAARLAGMAVRLVVMCALDTFIYEDVHAGLIAVIAPVMFGEGNLSGIARSEALLETYFWQAIVEGTVLHKETVCDFLLKLYPCVFDQLGAEDVASLAAMLRTQIAQYTPPTDASNAQTLLCRLRALAIVATRPEAGVPESVAAAQAVLDVGEGLSVLGETRDAVVSAASDVVGLAQG